MFTIRFSGKVWLYEGKSAWHFLTLSPTVHKRIKNFVGKDSGPWGSVKVEVTIGKTRWATSIFPDKKRGSYLLPLKAAIRKKERIKSGDVMSGTLTIGPEIDDI